MIKCPDCEGECSRKLIECENCDGTGEVHPDCLFCGEPNTTEDAKEGEDCEACANTPKCKTCGDPLRFQSIDRIKAGLCLTCLNRQRKEQPMEITTKKLPSGYWHIRGEGPCNWAQPPSWPCSEEVFREHAFLEAGEEFIRSALRQMPQDAQGKDNHDA